METKITAWHAARVSRRQNGKVCTSVLIRRTHREGGKVKHQTLSDAPTFEQLTEPTTL
jgi:hypothetical protein